MIRRVPYYLLLAAVGASCDAVHPESPAQLVVEAYVTPGDLLPAIRLRGLLPLSEPYTSGGSTAVTDAVVRVAKDAVWFDYTAASPGVYVPTTEARVQAGAEMRLEVLWQQRIAAAETRVPPALALDNVTVAASETPVSGLILDSLFIDPSQIDTLRFDSLRTGASEGYVYLVEVTMQWQVDFDESGANGQYWVRTQLRPELVDRTKLDDYFLRPEQLLREVLIARDATGRRTWTGVYAVPVASASAALPAHRLRVALVRGTHAYAQFVSGSDNPKHREPPSNVDGALGIFAGISVDTLSVRVQ